MKILNLLIIAFAFLIGLIKNQITISSPNELSSLFNFKELTMNFANYGKIPYGFLFTGKLFYDLNDKEDDYACKPLDKFHENFENQAERFPIIMVDRGNCTFVTKSRNVQNLGGSLALIINNREDESVENVLMMDDGTASDIYIPTVIISKKDGEKIKRFMIENKDNLVKHDILLTIEFEMPELDYVDFKVFLTSSHLNIYRLFKELSKNPEFIFNYTNFSPHYISYKSLEYKENSNKTIPNCIGKGLYCALPRYDLGVIDGRDIIIEDIRQKCIYNIANDLYKSQKFQQPNNTKKIYFEYMTHFFDKCLNKTEKRFNYYCSKEVMNDLGIKHDLVLECVSSSYIVDSEKNIVDLDNNNKILEEEKKVRSIYKIKVLPAVLINNKTISGSWDSINIQEAICAGFKKRPYACTQVLYEYSQKRMESKTEGISFSFIFWIVVILIVLNILIFLICRIYLNMRIGQRIENVEMNGRINSVVSNYLKLKNDTSAL